MAEPSTSKPSRLWRAVLVISLGLNLLVAGLVVGALSRDHDRKPPRGGFDFQSGPLGSALSREDRREIGRNMRERHERGDFGRNMRGERQRMALAIKEIVSVEPFDQQALEAVLAEGREVGSRVQRAAHESLVDHIAAMTPEERAAFAERLGQDKRRRD